jgi:serine/threonine protein kinase
MEERYEIRGKIGQGGLGAVYRGYDTRMNREVAIKRISVNEDDPELKEESTRQLIKEAGALASLQHPHIVTVYDVGADEDGPYVVMELISGKTLDELIERAPLTWEDFRELALQTQEALIAAQELDLIHSDIKPSNLMLTWLPSGKFQMKIVDFGLATLTQSQSLEELQEIEAVFGSIFFMAPEQFERVPIDARTDMYAMGCVYYQALTGTYPFQGETGNEVMESHLYHQVIPIQEVRSDIPLWACDWIMWHINRQAADRPESARQALQVFLQNDKRPNPTLSLGRAAKAVPAGPRTRLIIPGAGTDPAAANRRVIPPGPRAHAPAGAGTVPHVIADPAPSIPEPARTSSAPQPLLPPEGSKPSIYSAPEDKVETEQHSTAATATGRLHQSAIPARHYKIPEKKGPSLGLKIAIAVSAAIVLAVVGIFLLNRIKASKASQRYGNLLTAVDGGATEILISRAELDRMLEEAANADSDAKQLTLFKALSIAKPNDKTDVDAVIVEFVTKSTQLLPEVREAMIRLVIGKRMTISIIPALLNFARNTPDTRSALSAYQALRPVAGDDQLEALLSVAQFGTNPELKKAAEECAIDLIKRSRNKKKLLGSVASAIKSTTNEKIKAPLTRIQAAAK